MKEYYDIEVAGLKRRLPILPISDKMAIAAFVILGDCEMPCAAAKALKDQVPAVDWIVTAETKGIPLAHELARQLGMSSYITARKRTKLYMQDPISVTVTSITTEGEQQLWLDGADAEKIRGKRVLLVDDVISTGESIAAIRALTEKAGGIVAGTACILTEGDPKDHEDVICLGNLPLFPIETE